MARKLLAAFVFLTFGMLFIPSLLSSPVVSAQAGTGTLSFGVPVNVQNDVGNGSYPVVVNQGNNVFITWTESNGVYFRDYNATTELYTPPIGSPPASIPLNSKNPSHFSFPLAAMNGTNVYVLWAQSVKFPKGDQQVFVSVSNKSGAPGTFTTINASTPFKLSKGLATISVEPAITAWGNDVYVTWTGSSSTFVSSSTNDGKNWSAPVELLSIPREQQISAFGSDAYIVGDSGSNGLVLSYTTNNGGTWSTAPIRTKGVTFENSGVSETWVSAYGAYVYVTWETKDASASSCSGRISCNSTIYAAYGTLSAGKVTMHDYTISSIGQELNSTNGSFFDPQIAAYGNYAFLTYHKVGGNTVFVRVVNTT
ncbi:MAG TPA: hypothetical protein VJN71_00400, partial [Nitrososphaerales archaeon]|nr:hypothetical protein [Nitrososphaerales archaeon]